MLRNTTAFVMLLRLLEPHRLMSIGDQTMPMDDQEAACPAVPMGDGSNQWMVKKLHVMLCQWMMAQPMLVDDQVAACHAMHATTCNALP